MYRTKKEGFMMLTLEVLYQLGLVEVRTFSGGINWHLHQQGHSICRKFPETTGMLRL
jgi:hypothetical protein